MPASARWMTEKQIAEMVELAKCDPNTWTALLQREEELEAYYRAGNTDDDAPVTQPSMPMIVHELIEGRYGKGHGYESGSLILAIRRELRSELGCST